MVTTESEHVRADSRTFATLGHAHESITAKRNALHCPRWGRKDTDDARSVSAEGAEF
jgi:hypothetical protein